MTLTTPTAIAIMALFKEQYKLLDWNNGYFDDTFENVGFDTAEELETIEGMTSHTFFFGVVFQTDDNGQPGPLGVSGHQVI